MIFLEFTGERRYNIRNVFYEGDFYEGKAVQTDGYSFNGGKGI